MVIKIMFIIITLLYNLLLKSLLPSTPWYNLYRTDLFFNIYCTFQITKLVNDYLRILGIIPN